MHDTLPRTDALSPLAEWDDAPPVAVIEAASPAALVIVCDHASNRVPGGLDGLGLSRDELARHIAWDIGAAEVVRDLAGLLGATAVLSAVSRLVIDCNRPIGHETSICAVSDGVVIPGNRALAPAAAAVRATSFHRPYHDTVAARLARLERGGVVPAVVALHSFTPVMNGQARPWEVGVLWNRDPRLARPLISALRARGLCVGDNEPYSGRTANHTVDTHGGAHGRPHVSIEIRQDLIADPAGTAGWARLLAECLAPILARPEAKLRQRF